ncbi:hypothetical protein MMC29_001073 [Sticta canariensis]|nr:hypothetical protein [Sticta canariensis]
MPHESNGYFYYRYTYHCPYTDAQGNRHIDTNYHSAYYSPAREDHVAQTKWLREKALPAAQADIQKFYSDANRNLKGLVYEPFNYQYIHQEAFWFTHTPDKHTSGPLKGLIFGREI